MKKLMDKEVLERRFDGGVSTHLQHLWEQVVEGFDLYIAESKGVTFWQCETVQIPFQSVCDAPLISLLSESAHPTEGNDFLFLLIHDIGQRYNSFVSCMHELVSADSEGLVPAPEEVHPKMLITSIWRASGLVPNIDMSTVLSRHWIGGVFDTTEMESDALQQIGLHKSMPLIKNLVSFLREPMQFSDEEKIDSMEEGNATEGRRSTAGFFFAKTSDYDLFEDVLYLVERPSVSENQVRQIRESGKALFRGCDYSKLRSILSGVQSVMNFVKHGAIDDTGMLIREVAARASNQDDGAIMAMWFPRLANDLADFMGALSLGSLQIFASWVGEQLATEAYLFGHLPLYMTDEMPSDAMEQIKLRVISLTTDTSAQEVLQLVKEFVLETLAFYERAMVEVDATESMCNFLANYALCKKKDIIFSLLPEGLTVRHYVSLRKMFHQLQFELVQFGDQQEPREQQDVQNTRRDRRGHCWLWTCNEVKTAAQDSESEQSEEDSLCDRDDYSLWFESAIDSAALCEKNDTIEGQSDAQVGDVEAKSDSEDADKKRRAAFFLQRWTKKYVKGKAVGHTVQNFDVVQHEPSGSEKIEHETLSLPSRTRRISRKNRVVMILALLFFVAGWTCWHYKEMRSMTNSIASNGPNVALPANIAAPLTADETKDAGSVDEKELLQWLKDRRVYSSDLQTKLVAVGARDVSDLRLIHEADPAFFDYLPPLDSFKLKRAIGVLN
jgi:hypothetical protein